MIALFAAFVTGFTPVQEPRVAVSLVRDEADAALAILDKRRAGTPIENADWQALFATEGYRRLKRREEGFKRPFEESAFREFLLADATVAQAKALRETLDSWSKLDLSAPAQKALAYLPPDAKIRVKVYPSIKPQSNTFVFEVKSDPAIFFYLEPGLPAAVFENTLAHEFHHIGYGTSCPTAEVKSALERLPAPVKRANEWVGAFGEGMAMLAAAGGPDVHPHQFSPKEDRERWESDMAHFDRDLAAVEQFLLDILAGKLSEEEETKQGYGFFGVQGPWYTVGWKMAVFIEKTLGREVLIDCMRDPRKLLPSFNLAVEKGAGSPKPAKWSRRLLDALQPKG